MKTIRRLWHRLRQDLHERWVWYQSQRRVPLARRWWDAYYS
jgi:hypothetical protein